MCLDLGRTWNVCRTAAFALMCAVSAACGEATDAFYATADNKLITIQVRDTNDVTVTPVGDLGAEGCGAIGRSPSGALYSVCGPGIAKPGPQQLATLDPKTGRATTVGMVVEGLQVMGLEFAPDGTLYTVGDANPASPTFSSLYTVDVTKGALTRIGSTGASFFHDFAFDSSGTMYGTTSDALYTIDLKTGTATKVVDFVGGGAVMGLSFNASQNRLYATDYKKPVSAVYQVDLATGFLTPVAATGFPLAHGLAPLTP
jgi:DNA-binding beta-propeller fold protein YncE